MSLTNQMIQQLKEEKAAIDETIAALEGLLRQQAQAEKQATGKASPPPQNENTGLKTTRSR